MSDTVTSPPVAVQAPSEARGGLLPWLARHRWTVVTLLLMVGLFRSVGIPLDLLALLLFATLVLLIDALTTKGIEATKQIAKDWAPVFGVLVFYDFTGRMADTVGMPLQVQAPINVDKAMFFGEVPTIWLQDRLVGEKTAWWEVITTLTYVSHFFVTLVLGVYLYLRARHRWLPFLWRFCVLNMAGLITFVLLPTAPPWWAAERGVIDGVDRVISRGWQVLGLKSAGALVTIGQDRANEVAAIPSLHTGWAVLVCLFLWPTARRARPILLVYPFLMGFTLVYGGEHYVIDLLLGALYAWGAHAAVNRWQRRRRLRLDTPDGAEAANAALA